MLRIHRLPGSLIKLLEAFRPCFAASTFVTFALLAAGLTLVQKQYASLDLDLADAVNVGLAAQYRTDAILTLDRRDFRVVHPLTPHKWFRLLPDDLQQASPTGSSSPVPG